MRPLDFLLALLRELELLPLRDELREPALAFFFEVDFLEADFLEPALPRELVLRDVELLRDVRPEDFFFELLFFLAANVRLLSRTLIKSRRCF